MFGGRWMDTFMDKLAQKLNAQEMIKANSAADAEEMDQLKSQLREYDECLAQMQQVNKELKAINQEMEKLMSETIAPEVTKLSEEGVVALQKLQQENTEKLEAGMEIPAGNKDQTGQSKRCGICCFCCCLCGCAQSANSHLEIPDSVLCFCRRCSGTLFYGIYPDRNVRRLYMGTG